MKLYHLSMINKKIYRNQQKRTILMELDIQRLLFTI